MESLLVFAKSPEHQKVKTRLAKSIGFERATELYCAFMLDVADLADAWRTQKQGSDPNRRVVLCTTPDTDDVLIGEIARRCGARIVAQSAGDLGERLRHAFDAEYARGARSVCAIGTDSPSLPLYLIDEAFRALLFEDVVIGPTFDGGYWLIGAQRPGRHLFDDIEWSTSRVTSQTLSNLRAKDVDAHLLNFWYDVDEAADLVRLKWHIESIHKRHQSACKNTLALLQRLDLDATLSESANV